MLISRPRPDLLVVGCRDVARCPESGDVATLVGHHMAPISVVDEVAPSEGKLEK